MAKKIVNKEIPISCIKISPHHQEREHSPSSIDDLAKSIAERGQFHQILVRPLGKAGKTFELISGKKRLMALARSGARTARCAVAPLNNEDAEIASLEENLLQTEMPAGQRKDAMKRLLELYTPREEEEQRQKVEEEIQAAEEKRGVNPTSLSPRPRSPLGRPKSAAARALEKVAKRAGVSVTTARRDIKKAVKLSAAAAKALEENQISASQADILAGMPAKQQQQELAKMRGETREGSRERHTSEKLASGDTKTMLKVLTHIYSTAADLKTKINETLIYMDSRELDYDALLSLERKPAKECAEALEELVRFLET